MDYAKGIRKIPRSLENPIDNVLLDAADASLPVCRTLRLTPNAVTMMSIACEIAAVWCLARRNIVFFAAFASLGVFFDYVDGHYARADNMVTRLGDILDHVSDWAYVIGVLGVLVWTLGKRSLPWLGIIAALCVASSVQLGCQQAYYHARNPWAPRETLDALPCIGDPERTMKVSRFFGVGTMQLGTILVAALAVSSA